jgi:hypothetical protein
LNSNECDIGSGAIYLFDEKWLSEILSKNSKILENAKVPHDNIKKYIMYISNNTVYKDVYPEAYVVIGKTFNDPRFS